MPFKLPGSLQEDEHQLAERRLGLRDQLIQPLLSGGWLPLYATICDRHISATLLDPSETLQVSLRVPLSTDPQEGLHDWDLWLEASDQTLSTPLREWLEQRGETSAVIRLTGQPDPTQLDLAGMVRIAQWLQKPIATIECLARSAGSQLVLHLAGYGPLS